MKLINSYISPLGIEKKIYYDSLKDEAVFSSVQDVAPILKNNALEREFSPDGRVSGAHTRVAHIPWVLINEWKKQGLDVFDRNNDDILLRMLRSSDWQALRTSEAKI